MFCMPGIMLSLGGLSSPGTYCWAFRLHTFGTTCFLAKCLSCGSESSCDTMSSMASSRASQPVAVPRCVRPFIAGETFGFHSPAVRNIFVQVFGQSFVFYSLRCRPGDELLDHMVILCSTFSGVTNHFRSNCTIFYSP